MYSPKCCFFRFVNFYFMNSWYRNSTNSITLKPISKWPLWPWPVELLLIDSFTLFIFWTITHFDTSFVSYCWIVLSFWYLTFHAYCVMIPYSTWKLKSNLSSVIYIPLYRYNSQRLCYRLAALDHNHHVALPQRQNAFGEPMYTRRWSKKAGRWVLVKIKQPKDYPYITHIIALAMKSRQDDTKPVSRSVKLGNFDPQRIAASIAKLPQFLLRHCCRAK